VPRKLGAAARCGGLHPQRRPRQSISTSPGYRTANPSDTPGLTRGTADLYFLRCGFADFRQLIVEQYNSAPLCRASRPTGRRRRLPRNEHNEITGFPQHSGKRRPCRDARLGAIPPGFAMLKRAKRASHIDPPASSYAIIRRASPYRGENPGPGKMLTESLNPGLEFREQPGFNASQTTRPISGRPHRTAKGA
jgi:hypothetical protein